MNKWLKIYVLILMLGSAVNLFILAFRMNDYQLLFILSGVALAYSMYAIYKS